MQNRVIFTLSIVALAAACGSTIKDAARAASKSAVKQSVDTLTSEKAMGDLAAAVDDPRVESVTHQLADQVAEGILRSLESPRAHERIAAITSTAVEAATLQMLATLSSDRSRKQVEALSVGVVDSVWHQTAENMKTDLGPAFGALMRDELGRELGLGISSALNEPLRGALGATAQNVAYHAVLGANTGLGAVLGADGTQRNLQGVWETGRSWLWLAVICAALLALALLFAAITAIARASRVRSEITRLETTALLLATAMREQSPSHETSEIVSMVQQALEKSAHSHGRNRVLGMLGLRRADHH